VLSGIGDVFKTRFFPDSALHNKPGTCLADAMVSPDVPGMTELLPACPHLPVPEIEMNWKSFSAHRHDRGAEFYLTALQYGQHLWRRRFAARSILCLDRALGADLRGDEEVLQRWPLPYQAMAWILKNTPPGLFIGNPRVHFQHYADRMNEPRRDVRRWRAWACWALSRVVLPELPADPRHRVEEPIHDRIVAMLKQHGHPGEAELWLHALEYAQQL